MIFSSETASLGLLICLFGTFAGAILAVCGKSGFFQKMAQGVLLLALLAGLSVSIDYLLQGENALVIWKNNFFFPGNLVLDSLSAIFLILINLVGFFATIYGVKYIQKEKGHYNLGYLQFLTALFLLGMQLTVLATTPVFFLFAWEIMSFASFLLVIADLRTDSIRPAIFYLVVTHLGAGAILSGFLLISNGAFAVDFSSLGEMAKDLTPILTWVTLLLFLIGFGSKAGLVPLHGWLPEAHPQAPSHISALMSGVMLKIAVYGFLRVILFFSPDLPLGFGYVVIAIGLISAFLGVLYSVIETDIKRILAFSSIENLGLIFTMLGIFIVARNQQMELLAGISLLTALFQSICHALFKSGLFLTAGVAGHVFGTRNIEKMGGMAKKMRLFSLGALFLMLTSAALPPSGAFISEWLIFDTIIQNLTSATISFKIVLLLTMLILGIVAGIAIFSMVRYFAIAFLADSRTPDAHLNQDPENELLFPVLFLSFGAFLLGAISAPVLSLLNKNLSKIIGTEILAKDFTVFPFNPFFLFLLMAGILLLAVFAKKTFSQKKERPYHTWDCGQPIDASMEYTATAFSAPLRFFFDSFLHSSKKITFTPIVASNPYLLKKSIKIGLRPMWDLYFYHPVVKIVALVSGFLRKLQNGNIQFYIALILISLILTAIFSL